MKKTRTFARALFATGLLAWGLSGPGAAQDLPGKGITVQPIKSSVAEELFQSLLVSLLRENEIDFVHVKEADYDARFLRCVELVKEMMGEQG